MTEQSTVLQSATPSPSSTLGDSTKKKRGFAAMDAPLVRELARRGGAAAHRAGTAHEFSSEEARAAGRKGGIASSAGRMASPRNEGITLDGAPSSQNARNVGSPPRKS
jgi:general stress protein YciG